MVKSIDCPSKGLEYFEDRRCYYLVWLFQLLTVALAVTDTQLAGLLTRYFGDFVWIGMIAGIFVILAQYDWLERGGRDCRFLQRLVAAVCAVTLLSAFLRIFAHSEDAIRSANPALYYQVQSLIAFWM